MKLPNKHFFKEQKKRQLKYYQMVLYTIQSLLLIKDTLNHSHPVALTITLKFAKIAL